MKNNLGNNQDSFRNSGQTAVVLLPLIDEDITQVDIREKRRKEEETRHNKEERKHKKRKQKQQEGIEARRILN